MSQQKTVSPPTSCPEVEYDGGVEDGQKREETTNFLFSYVISRSSADDSLSTEQVQTFQSVNDQVHVEEREEAAIAVGKRLAQLGECNCF